jgi:hypothetical protein
LHWRALRWLTVPMPLTSKQIRPGWSAVMIALLPVLTYYPYMELAQTPAWPVSPHAPQQLTNGLILWAFVNASFGVVAMVILGRGGATLASVGLWPVGFDLRRLVGSLVAAAAIVAVAYLALLGIEAAFHVDFRFWVVAFKPLAPWHVTPYFVYVVPLSVMFAIVGASLNQFIVGAGTQRAILRCVLILTNGFIALLALQYVPLMAGMPMPLGQPLLTVVAIQFVVLLAIAAIVIAVFQRATGSVYLAAFVNAFLIAWSAVGGTATHYPL